MKLQLLLGVVTLLACVLPVCGQLVEPDPAKDDSPSLEPMMSQYLGKYDEFPAGAKLVSEDEVPYWRGLVLRAKFDGKKSYQGFFVKRGNGWKKVEFVGEDELTPAISAVPVTSRVSIYNCQDVWRESADVVYITKKRVSNAKCPHPVHDDKALQQRIEKVVGRPVNADYVASLGEVAIQATAWDEKKALTPEQKASFRADQIFHRAGDLGVSVEVLDKAITVFAPEYKKRWADAMEWEAFH